ncbi:putative Methylenetetrahydrofolate reductase [Paratrimastix pyriformis]|uniref:Methylenetetrahydrofolate reductase n=1 Tax=Paratrimastix pyriformis TaxID=342808 RepID=A0ABQ8U6W0_9EUKA|nr:putative Methylenetetrahydrofolate reductase [Paratrimastix pyriformis]
MTSLFKYRTDFDKIVLATNFEKRGWSPTSEALSPDRANKRSIKVLFGPESGIRLNDCQIINHFPNHYELTRKDTLIKNLKRYQKELARDGKLEEVGNVMDYVPMTFSLPGDYSVFIEEFRRTPNTTWIVKPGAKSQGSGIFLINKPSQAKKWMASKSIIRNHHFLPTVLVVRQRPGPRVHRQQLRGLAIH